MFCVCLKVDKIPGLVVSRKVPQGSSVTKICIQQILKLAPETKP